MNIKCNNDFVTHCGLTKETFYKVLAMLFFDSALFYLIFDDSNAYSWQEHIYFNVNIESIPNGWRFDFFRFGNKCHAVWGSEEFFTRQEYFMNIIEHGTETVKLPCSEKKC